MKKFFALTLIIILFITSCKNHQEYFSTAINNDWEFRKAGDSLWLPATVPGCVHNDLLNNKKIEDPFFRYREDSLQWIEKEDWEYRTRFDVCECILDNDKIELLFEGIDTYADVYLNDSLLFSADNMFISHRIDCKKYIKAGMNDLKIYFHSPVNVEAKKFQQYGFLPRSANERKPESERTRVFSRKAPFHYGWDWGPRLVTSGIWRPVYLESWSDFHIDDMYLRQLSVSPDKAEYNAEITIISNADKTAKINILIDNTTVIENYKAKLVVGENTIIIPITIDKPELWWTNGLGDQKLYEVKALLLKGNSKYDEISRKLGVRTLELVQKPDSIGTSFYFKLNGVPVFMKGSNYIPGHIFTTSVSDEMYQRVIDDALDAHMNMLRIWGGAIYEENKFYDMLDENGILAWQDFMFACDMMPGNTEMIDNIKKEAEYNVKRLRHHPCIALWCGNNENYRAWNDWNWKKQYPEEQANILWKTYDTVFHHILPNAVKKYNSEISYWPSSPQSSTNGSTDRISGDEHDWGVWFGELPFSHFAWNTPRFVSEYGVQSYPSMKTLKAFADDNDMAYRSPLMEHRQRSKMDFIEKDLNGNGMIMRYIEKYYRKPKNFEAYVYLSQVMHGDGLKYSIETHRSKMPRCMGSLYWQINDCWPTMSWASVDYFGRWKGPHYLVRKANEEMILVATMNDKNFLEIKTVSDKLQSINDDLILQVISFDGEIILEKELPIVIKENTSNLVYSENDFIAKNKINPRNSVLYMRLKKQQQVSNLFYFKPNKDLLLPTPSITHTINKKGAYYQIVLSSNVLAKTVYIETDTEGFFSENWFDILPGEKAEVAFIPETLIDSLKIRVYTMVDSY